MTSTALERTSGWLTLRASAVATFLVPVAGAA
jgi:hypothetical protein